MAESELKKIKKTYGERFMKLCRELFPTILEHEGLLFNILSSSFSNNGKTLYDDIHNANLEEEFKDYIYSKTGLEDSEKPIIEEKTPYELLNEAGYDLFECTTEEEIQKLKIVGDGFLYENLNLNELILPSLEKTGDNFLYNNQALEILELPNLKCTDYATFLKKNKNFKKRSMISNITAKNIAKLDGENNITEAEISGAKKIFRGLNRETERNINEK